MITGPRLTQNQALPLSERLCAPYAQSEAVRLLRGLDHVVRAICVAPGYHRAMQMARTKVTRTPGYRECVYMRAPAHVNWVIWPMQ